ncbi:hypothetical protein D7231_03615 [Streptomyces klenkii]|uniref:Uncharacterized protein n=1 Tax=Streptomyces klenkii TaxID=1420899 RepID=A0A3B0BS64_9ACTN|nr:hypothetical protein D7231_03615 [Streptomyces klenkii]
MLARYWELFETMYTFLLPRRSLAAQAPYTRVAGVCDCGCLVRVPENAGTAIFAEDSSLPLLEIYTSVGDPVATWPEPHFFQQP